MSFGYVFYNMGSSIFLQSLITIVMYMEVLAVLIRQRSHIRITRVLRPIFVLDTYYFGGVRRYVLLLMRPLNSVMFLGQIYYVLANDSSLNFS